MKRDEQIYNEFEIIRKEHKGILKPSDVVETASDKNNILHKNFEWDDSKAGVAYRLWQARQLIKSVKVEIIDYDLPLISPYVSIKEYRNDENGGYRLLADVLKDENLKKELLKEALAEFNRVKREYKQLKELVPIFEAIENVENGVLTVI